MGWPPDAAMGSAPSSAGRAAGGSGAETAADEAGVPATKALGALAKKSGVAAEELLAMDAANKKLEATTKKADANSSDLAEQNSR